ncbi:MAG: thioredoxin family protein [Burkholderiaceae bacterium]|nr:thioredoxin family protein [Burkholderiaceae bacterium]
MTLLSTSFLRGLCAAVALTASAWAQALEVKPFSAEALAAAQQAGQPVAVHFHAEWCPTCKLQEKALTQLKGESGLDLTVLVADYDKEKELKKAMRVRTQSTLVVFRGTQEKARLAGDTAADKIRAALKAAL